MTADRDDTPRVRPFLLAVSGPPEPAADLPHEEDGPLVFCRHAALTGTAMTNLGDDLTFSDFAASDPVDPSDDAGA